MGSQRCQGFQGPQGEGDVARGVQWPAARCSALSGEAGCLLQNWKPWGLRSQQLGASFALFFKGTEGIC